MFVSNETYMGNFPLLEVVSRGENLNIVTLREKGLQIQVLLIYTFNCAAHLETRRNAKRTAVTAYFLSKQLLCFRCSTTVVESQKVVAAYITSKQLLSFWLCPA